MLNGREKAIDFIKFNGFKFWKLRRNEKGPYLFVFQNEDSTMQDSEVRLKDALNYLEPGNYWIETGEKATDTRGWHSSPFRIEGAGYGIGNLPVSGIGTLTPELVQEKINEALSRERQTRDLEDLRKKLLEAETKAKELEREKDSFLMRLGNGLVPYIGTIIEGFGITPSTKYAPARIAGIDEPNKNQNMAEKAVDQQKRLEIAFEKWAKYESDPALVIEKIVELAETNPKVYAKAKNILFNPEILNILT
jgi:hypothetical protein